MLCYVILIAKVPAHPGETTEQMLAREAEILKMVEAREKLRNQGAKTFLDDDSDEEGIISECGKLYNDSDDDSDSDDEGIIIMSFSFSMTTRMTKVKLLSKTHDGEKS
jgi:hypothetical protein